VTTHDPLAEFRGRGQTAAPAPKPAAEKQPYEAFRLSTTERRYVDFRPKFPDLSIALPNHMLIKVAADWRAGLGGWLKFSYPAVVDIDGKNIPASLFRAFQEWKVEFVAEFDPVEHLPPTDPAAPLITRLSIHFTRPEEPPPANQRH
jgi:hypothetical protein